ncbi:MAG: CPBP family intramembrane glutamic endopeptidase [Acidobacteriota bacterium]
MLSGFCFVGIFSPLMTFGQVAEVDVDSLEPIDAFLTQFLLIGTLGLWLFVAFVGVPRLSRKRMAALARRHLGLRLRAPGLELLVGVWAGLAAWAAVLMAALVFGLFVMAVAGEEAVAQEPSEVIVWMAGLPVAIRLLISLTAGVVEEVFFRGFLQQRVGIAASTVLFVGGHAGYGQPMMLFGLTLLSLLYAYLTRWRGSVWAAIVAHFLFDAVQLLIVIPGVLEASARGLIVGFAWVG